MSSAYWQTVRQSEQFSSGNTATQKVSDYVRTWKSRCYEKDIPDQVSAKLMKSNRAPSYQAIALAILNNDHGFRSLGFSQNESDLSHSLIRTKAEKLSGQKSMF